MAAELQGLGRDGSRSPQRRWPPWAAAWSRWRSRASRAPWRRSPVRARPGLIRRFTAGSTTSPGKASRSSTPQTDRAQAVSSLLTARPTGAPRRSRTACETATTTIRRPAGATPTSRHGRRGHVHVQPEDQRQQRMTNLRLSGQTIAGIFTDKITKWNDPVIEEDNPGVTMPRSGDHPGRPLRRLRRDPEFTQWMIATQGSSWNAYCAKVGAVPVRQTSTYPVLPGSAMIGQSGDLGVSGYVASSRPTARSDTSSTPMRWRRVSRSRRCSTLRATTPRRLRATSRCRCSRPRSTRTRARRST